MPIELDYYRWGRHKCGWVHRGSEQVESSILNTYFSPINVELIVGYDDRGEYSNLVIQDNPKNNKNTIKCRNQEGEILDSTIPILLIPGEAVSLKSRNLLMEIAFINSEIYAERDYMQGGYIMEQKTNKSDNSKL